MNWNFVRAITGNISCPFAEKGGNQVGQILPCIFRDFILEKPIINATLTATALGIYEPWMNGKRIGKRYFAPGWTDYNKLVYAQTYDVTSFCQPGMNRIGALLGDGWFAGNISDVQKVTYGNRIPELAMNLTIQYEDGTQENISTEKDFQFVESDILYADYYMGEWIDHRRTCVSDIMSAGYINGAFVEAGDGTPAEIVADFPLQVQEERILTPLSVWTGEAGELIVDFGQNFVGNIRLTVRGEEGSTITVRYGEMLNADNSIYVDNLRGAKSTDRFICGSEKTEVFLPNMTFHGFRYAEIVSDGATIDQIEGVVLTTILEQTGHFSCDHDMVNQLYSNIIWGMKGNFLELPTDCPQRDERMGWCGDAQVFCRTAMYNQDCKDFYRKYLRNVRDSANPEGAPCDIAPAVAGFPHGNAAWADAIVVIPYQHYLFYGDKRVIYENLEAMEAWIQYQLMTADGYLRPETGYGDWLSVIIDETPKDLLGTAYFAYTTHLLAYLCNEIDEIAKAEKYQKLAEKIKDAYNKHYISKDGRILSDSQCSYLVTLGFDLVDDTLAKKVANKLRERILRDNCHLTCGFVGISLLLPVLTKWNMTDLAYTILLNDTYPSWGYSIKNGATTIWERWNSWTKENGFADIRMNSFNHYSLGSCGEWFFGYMCGILPAEDAPGFQELVIAPHLDPLKRIKHAKATHQCPYGEIVSEWEIKDAEAAFQIVVPAGVTAQLKYNGRTYPLSCGANHITEKLDFTL